MALPFREKGGWVADETGGVGGVGGGGVRMEDEGAEEGLQGCDEDVEMALQTETVSADDDLDEAAEGGVGLGSGGDDGMGDGL